MRLEWLVAMLRERDAVRGRRARVRWLFGVAKVAVLEFLPELAAIGTLGGVVGGTIANAGAFRDVERTGSDTWMGAVAFALPVAVAGLVASALVLRRHRLASRAAYLFLALVAVASVVSVRNLAPVRPFMHDWQRTAAAHGDARAAHHAEELRFNSALGAIVAAMTLAYAARRRTARARR